MTILNFTFGLAGSLGDQGIGLDTDPKDSLYVSGCTSQLEFDAATSIANSMITWQWYVYETM